MGGFLFWLAIVLCVIALVILFFPFRFKVEFEAGSTGAGRYFSFSGRSSGQARNSGARRRNLAKALVIPMRTI